MVLLRSLRQSFKVRRSIYQGAMRAVQGAMGERNGVKEESEVQTKEGGRSEQKELSWNCAHMGLIYRQLLVLQNFFVLILNLK